MIYLDNGATTFYKPPAVIKAGVSALKYLSANPGRSGHALSLKVATLVHKTRQRVAKHLNLECGNIVFTLNCSHALNAAIFGIVKKGGHVITTCLEHNSVLRPLFELKRGGFIELTVLSPLEHSDSVSANQIERARKQNTCLCVINHVSNVTGAMQPVGDIGAICRRYNIPLLVDGAQSGGYIDIDMKALNIDMLALAPHKGFHAATGVGVLAVREGLSLVPRIYGGTGTDSLSLYQPTELPESLECGTLPTPNIASLNAAIYWSEQNLKATHDKISALSEYTIQELKKVSSVKIYTAKNSVGSIVAFNIGTMHSTEVADILSTEYNICVRGGLHCAPLMHKHLNTLEVGIVRASLGFDTSFSEVNALISAVKKIACG